MDIQYKPSKLKKQKPVKAPKAPKAEKPVKMGSVKAVKVDKPKLAKEPKIKDPKPEKALTFTPAKVEKARDFKTYGKVGKRVNSKIVAAALAAVAVIVLAVVLVVNLQDNEPGVEPLSLSVSKYPDKTTYYVGEAAAFNGLKLKMTLTDGTAITVDGSECEIVGFNSSKPAETQIITVKYKEMQTTFSITIQEISTDLPDAKYTGISFKTLPKTNYKVKEWLDTSGGVLLVHYEDGTSREIGLIDDYVYGFSSDKPGTYTITVKYVERGLYAETTYTITVTE